MIQLSEDKKVKAAALARLKSGVSCLEVSEELKLPLPLVEEWSEAIDTGELVTANLPNEVANRIVRMATAEIVATEHNLEHIKENMERAANKIVNEVLDNSLIAFDLERARTLNLLAGSITGIYNALFNKNQTVNLVNNNIQTNNQMQKFIGRD